MSSCLEERIEQDGCEPSADIDGERFGVAEVEHVQRTCAVRVPRECCQGHWRHAG
jgi:hypothetical protein